MATWKPRTVREVVQDIDNEVYLLPVIQRSLVWSESKMELLFDSLLKKNSFGGIMILEEQKGDLPLFASRRFSQFGDLHHATLPEINAQTTYLVIDGQQRLQSFYMGLMGGINHKRLYFDLFGDQQDFDFRYVANVSQLPISETGDNDLPQPKLWYEVPRLYQRLRVVSDPHMVAQEISRQLPEEHRTWVDNLQGNVLKFFLSVFGSQTVGLSTVTVNRDPAFIEDEKQRIVELFRRLNDGGTRLSSLDLVASMFKGFDYRMEKFFRDMVQFEDIGIEQDEIIKLIFLLQDNHNKEVTQVTLEDTEFAIDNQDRIIQSLKGTRRFLEHAKLYNYYNVGGRSDIPLYFIAYHIFHKSRPTETLDKVYENFDANNPDFVRVKRWIYLSLLNRVFSRGCGWIPYRTGIRKILNVLKQHNDQLFPVNELFNTYRNHPLRFSEEISAARVESWDRDFLFYVIYGHDTISNRDVDHIHPKSRLHAAKEHDEQITDALIHSTANFQLLDPGTNRDQKRAKSLADWIQTGVTDRPTYLRRHLIPPEESMWTMDRVPQFLQQRATAISECVAENIPEGPEDPPVPQPQPEMGTMATEAEHASVRWQELVPEAQRGHLVLTENATWESVFRKTSCGPQWTSRYKRELAHMDVHTIADLAAAIMVLGLEFDESQTHGNAYRFHDTLPDGSRPVLRKRHFGGWAWSTVLSQLQQRGFDWRDYAVRTTP